VVGLAAQLVVTYTVLRMAWLTQLPPRRPKWLMRITLSIWALAVAGGVSVYVLLYGG
jgi:uncharacterized membrane protein YozB (DUF420 family)